MSHHDETTQQIFDDLARYIDEVYQDASISKTGSIDSCDFETTSPQAYFDDEMIDVEFGSISRTGQMSTLHETVFDSDSSTEHTDEIFTLSSFAPATAPTSLAERLRDLDESFAQTVLRLIDERGMKDAEVYKRANMSRQLFSKLRKDENYRPKKQTACALAFALELDLDTASELLDRAGFTLSHSSKFDIIIEYFLLNNVYDIMQVNEALFAYDQPLLG